MSNKAAATFIVRGAFDILEGCEVKCGPLHTLSYYQNPHDKKTLTQMRARQITTIYGVEKNIDLDPGLWIEDGYLLPLQEDVYDGETAVPGKHIRTLQSHVGYYVVSVVDYEDRAQCSVVNSANDEVIISTYAKKIHFGTLKYQMDLCLTEEDIFKFVSFVKELVKE